MAAAACALHAWFLMVPVRHQLAARRGDGVEGGAMRRWRWGGEAQADGEVGVGAARIWETDATTQLQLERRDEDLGKESVPIM